MKALVIYSGGMDSFTTLHLAVQQWGEHNVSAFSLDYGQRHKKELLFAREVCKNLGVKHYLFNAPELWSLLGDSALTAGGDVPEGHYEAESMKQTVVPNRNMILLSLAIGCAVSNKIGHIYLGVHSGDHAIYPDCRFSFIRAMQQAATLGNYEDVRLHTPFIGDDKAGILEWGLKRHLDYGQTWTCYNGRHAACGKCGACRERLEAFEKCGSNDPCEYEGNPSLVAAATPPESGNFKCTQ